ncbi:hypothetical protein M9H77_15689 [Catharanthus roseus]|uniref:Uncharacterized protein n=1 Tax=Catharanthus roseus TaxID=4058 RepID=A0ACC0B114_CATRO|nr:hypothetical protein M9H77_15689 [Catharanthus roseus]
MQLQLGAVSGRMPAVDLRLDRSLSTQPASFQLYVRCNLYHNKSDNVKSKTQNGRMFILGMGFLGQFFAADLKSKGWMVSGTCTSISKKKKLDEIGFDAYVFNANDPNLEVLDIIKYHTHLLVSVPPVLGVGDPMLQHKELLRSRLKDSNLQWLSYLSSTSVYGDTGGAWVHEDYPIGTSSQLGRARLAAEEGWLGLGRDLNIAVQIFRLGGIYGPGRSAIDTVVKQEAPSMKQRLRSSKRYTARIHVADICQALNASIQKPSSGRIYNIVDDDPAPRAEVFRFAQNLVKKKWPGHGQQCFASETAGSPVSEGDQRKEKRVSNTRMKEELGVQLLYSTYQSGLLDIIEHIDNPFV